jgi:putative restriction endonuclease
VRSRICPNRGLLDAAHIVMDADQQFGQPIVSNGLPLTKIHHAAFDAHLIGIDPDFRIHVSDRLLDLHDGQFLELGLKGIAGTQIEMAPTGGGSARSRPVGAAVRAIQESA